MRCLAIALALFAASVLGQQQQTVNLTLIEQIQFSQNISLGQQQNATQQQGASQQQPTIGELTLYGVNPVYNVSGGNVSSGQNISGAGGNLQANQVATMSGQCVRLVVSNSTGGQQQQQQPANETALFQTGSTGPIGISQCIFTLAFSQLNTVQIEGLVLDNMPSYLSIVGGTGSLAGASGTDERIVLSGNATQMAGEVPRWAGEGVVNVTHVIQLVLPPGASLPPMPGNM